MKYEANKDLVIACPPGRRQDHWSSGLFKSTASGIFGPEEYVTNMYFCVIQ
ncbi:MAG: hypothetical protein HY064_14285 [Bacteroidetes bacterium]|nr:hypothetical protein [Bacteroidota bacterium]